MSSVPGAGAVTGPTVPQRERNAARSRSAQTLAEAWRRVMAMFNPRRRAARAPPPRRPARAGRPRPLPRLSSSGDPPPGNDLMARASSRFVCGRCAHESAKWMGQCPGCGEWNTLAEEAAPASAGRGAALRGRAVRPVALAEVEAPRIPRLRTGIGELDRVLGGGLVPGSLVLLGGSP